MAIGDKKMKHIVCLSGGQDSTAMTLKMLEDGHPVDYIIFNDTTLEHDYMYEYINKLDSFIKRKYGMSITILKPNKSFLSWTYGKTTKGENIGMIRGTPRVSLPCFWRKEAKEYPTTRWIKEMGFTEYTKYIGYTITERNRAQNLQEYNSRAPLIEWNWSENDVKKYLKENHMENKLYEHFSRTGCAICPKQKLDDKYMIYKHYKDRWKYMWEVEKNLNKLKIENGEKKSPAWHDLYFMEDMEKLFIKKDKQQTFEFDFEEIQDCFCVI